MAWFNAGLSSNSGGASSSFNELDDVSINTQTLSNGQVPVYNSTTHKWENGEQSGGSSGHTILNDGGTSLTQRDNLQFKGAYSEDNSANGKTVVNVVRSMTKAQFDQLTNNEKTGLINITDITGGNDDRFQPVIYSEEEREIGVWTDGKPLYEKVFTISQITISSSWKNTTIDTTDIDTITSVFGIASDGTFYSGLDADPTASSHTVLQLRNYANAYVTKLILQYTKISDTAGSGQWTPQGVPAHHYSTDEQIVGTWIDGKTLYEKTWYFQSSMVTIYRSWTSLNINVSSLNIEEIVDHRAQSYSTESMSIDVWNDSGTLKAQYWMDGLNIGSVTIRYTKTST